MVKLDMCVTILIFVSKSLSFFFLMQDERSFTEDEEEKLETALGIEGRDLQLVLETTAFILEQVSIHIDLIQ